MFYATLLLLSCLLISSSQSFKADKVETIPGLSGSLPFNSYSGYLDATPGTHLHYVFVESQNDPANDPLLLWLNGGPGCSSLLGFFTEQGPFRVDGTKLVDNPYSWNKVANMIFLESPAGVGYSYSDSGNYTHDDDTTSLNNLLAIKSWFEKFPQYKEHDFYLTGESYAGVYIPTLSSRLLDEPEINYVGFAIGNGYLDQHLLGNSLIRFAYYHGLLDSQTWSQIVSSCCKHGDESPESCDFATNVNPKCNEVVNEANKFINDIHLNPYAIYEDCKTPTNSPLLMHGKTSSTRSKGHRSYREQTGWKLIKKTMNKIFHKKSESKDHEQDNEQVSGQTIPCVDDTILITYLSRSDVRESLHIPSKISAWTDCSEQVSSQYTMQYPSLKKQVSDAIKAGKRGLIYNGDTDMVCDFLGDEWFSDQLGFKQIGSYDPWYVNNQVAGFVKHYQGFAYATIRGSGHTVPEYRPAAALYMIEKFLNKNKLN